MCRPYIDICVSVSSPIQYISVALFQTHARTHARTHTHTHTTKHTHTQTISNLYDRTVITPSISESEHEAVACIPSTSTKGMEPVVTKMPIRVTNRAIDHNHMLISWETLLYTHTREQQFDFFSSNTYTLLLPECDICSCFINILQIEDEFSFGCSYEASHGISVSYLLFSRKGSENVGNNRHPMPTAMVVCNVILSHLH